MKTIEVVAAVIVHEHRYLCVQRGWSKYDYISKKYEFPGGKIEQGELPQQALKREIMEELSLDVNVGELLVSVNHQYPDFTIIMHAYLCGCKDVSLVLKEHLDSKWLLKDELLSLDWAAADVPIVHQLLS
jgi:8-oxo-dGTP diphosphatase